MGYNSLRYVMVGRVLIKMDVYKNTDKTAQY